MLLVVDVIGRLCRISAMMETNSGDRRISLDIEDAQYVNSIYYVALVIYLIHCNLIIGLIHVVFPV